MKYSYYIKDNGETIDDATEFEFKSRTDDFEFLQDIRKHLWNKDFSWDWHATSITITLCLDGKELGDFNIDLSYHPDFRAEKLESK
jgi:hypothetical protein